MNNDLWLGYIEEVKLGFHTILPFSDKAWAEVECPPLSPQPLRKSPSYQLRPICRYFRIISISPYLAIHITMTNICMLTQ